MGANRWRAFVGCLIVGIGWLSVLLLPPTEAAARPRAAVEVGDTGTLSADGQTATVEVTASCASRWQALEAFVTVSQSQADGMGGFPLTCTGRSQRFTVRVQSLDAPFQPGQAQVSAFVLIERRDRTAQAQDSESIPLS